MSASLESSPSSSSLREHVCQRNNQPAEHQRAKPSHQMEYGRIPDESHRASLESGRELAVSENGEAVRKCSRRFPGCSHVTPVREQRQMTVGKVVKNRCLEINVVRR